jgi:hypothetical protein
MFAISIMTADGQNCICIALINGSECNSDDDHSSEDGQNFPVRREQPRIGVWFSATSQAGLRCFDINQTLENEHFYMKC